MYVCVCVMCDSESVCGETGDSGECVCVCVCVCVTVGMTVSLCVERLVTVVSVW